MYSFGGRAFFNGVQFMSPNYIVRVKKKRDGSIVLNYSENSYKKLLHIRIKNWPVLRGFIELMINIPKKMLIFIIGLIVLDVVLFFLPQWNVDFSSLDLMISATLFVSILILCFFSPITKYHGAEHKVINAFNQNVELTIDSIKAQSRIAERCGTNLVSFLAITYLLCSLFTDNIFISFPLSLITSMELFRIQNHRIKKLLIPIYFLGNTAQKFLFTREPDDQHIALAMTCMQKLIDLEE